mgnify:CR=1 FL=1|jgi:hypothetical protein
MLPNHLIEVIYRQRTYVLPKGSIRAELVAKAEEARLEGHHARAKELFSKAVQL